MLLPSLFLFHLAVFCGLTFINITCLVHLLELLLYIKRFWKKVILQFLRNVCNVVLCGTVWNVAKHRGAFRSFFNRKFILRFSIYHSIVDIFWEWLLIGQWLWMFEVKFEIKLWYTNYLWCWPAMNYVKGLGLMVCTAWGQVCSHVSYRL
jgi:hypothetical protein